MIPAQPWWKADKYWERGESCRNMPDVPKIGLIVQEAERLGAERGKQEAWAKLLKILGRLSA